MCGFKKCTQRTCNRRSPAHFVPDTTKMIKIKMKRQVDSALRVQCKLTLVTTGPT